MLLLLFKIGAIAPDRADALYADNALVTHACCPSIEHPRPNDPARRRAVRLRIRDRICTVGACKAPLCESLPVRRDEDVRSAEAIA